MTTLTRQGLKRKHSRKGKPVPGVFFDPVTGKSYDIRTAYEGCKYDTVPVYTTFWEQLDHLGAWVAVRNRLPGHRMVYRAYSRIRVEWWKLQAGARGFRTSNVELTRQKWPQPERFLQALSSGINFWRHYWD